jgi:hypothetical protein
LSRVEYRKQEFITDLESGLWNRSFVSSHGAGGAWMGRVGEGVIGSLVDIRCVKRLDCADTWIDSSPRYRKIKGHE